MILWTIQPIMVYEQMKETGVYRCRTEESYFYTVMKEQYDWLVTQMKQRIGDPPKGVTLPVWAWYQWEGVRKKPDLRKERRANGFEGEEFVCLECDIPDQEVVLSDFDSWSLVIRDNLITWSEEEDSEIELLMSKLPEKEQKLLKHKNWEERLFDLTPLDYWWTIRGDSIQATFWELRLEQVKEVRYFKAAKKRRIL